MYLPRERHREDLGAAMHESKFKSTDWIFPSLYEKVSPMQMGPHQFTIYEVRMINENDLVGGTRMCPVVQSHCLFWCPTPVQCPLHCSFSPTDMTVFAFRWKTGQTILPSLSPPLPLPVGPQESLAWDARLTCLTRGGICSHKISEGLIAFRKSTAK